MPFLDENGDCTGLQEELTPVPAAAHSMLRPRLPMRKKQLFTRQPNWMYEVFPWSQKLRVGLSRLSLLTKYLPKLEITDSLDHDCSFPREETSSSVYPPILSLKLEGQRGYGGYMKIWRCHFPVVNQDIRH